MQRRSVLGTILVPLLVLASCGVVRDGAFEPVT
jgi:hypothetical protein